MVGGRCQKVPIESDPGGWMDRRKGTGFSQACLSRTSISVVLDVAAVKHGF